MASDSTRDRLSNLPHDIIETIFSNLSVREVVRTSVLSTEWRDKWISFPSLIFNDECIRGLAGSPGHPELVKIINDVLLVHRQPIKKFKLSSSHLQSCPKINTWVFSLVFDPLTELELQISEGSPHLHRVPHCLFSFKHLNRLTLVRCKIPEPPLSFKSFPFLTTLFLQRVTLSGGTLKCLLSCPELQNLTLKDNDGHNHIEISSPKLNYVSISTAYFITICLKDLKHLVHGRFADWPRLSRTSKFTNFFGSFLGIQELSLENLFLKCCANIDVPKRLPFTYHDLKSISFHLDQNYRKGILVVLCLLNCSPNLQKLQIEFLSLLDSNSYLKETKNQLRDMAFNSLRVIKFSRFFGLKIQLLLIKLLLANSPVLETMVIHSSPMDSKKESTFWKELLQFKRTSPQAEIKYY